MSWKNYRKRPVVVGARVVEVEEEIDTLEGTMTARVGDYVIEGVAGEHYPCKPDIFKATYEEVVGMPRTKPGDLPASGGDDEHDCLRDCHFCDECDEHLHGADSFWARDSVWLSVAGPDEQLHFACLQKRLGRPLRRSDFDLSGGANVAIAVGVQLVLDEFADKPRKIAPAGDVCDDYVSLVFPFATMTQEQRAAVFAAECSLLKAGIHFSTVSRPTPTQDTNVGEPEQWDLITHEWELVDVELDMGPCKVKLSSSQPGSVDPATIPHRAPIWAALIFPFDNMSDSDRAAVFEAQTHLQGAGLWFGSGSEMVTENGVERPVKRHWQLDWELKGAVLVQNTCRHDATPTQEDKTAAA